MSGARGRHHRHGNGTSSAAPASKPTSKPTTNAWARPLTAKPARPPPGMAAPVKDGSSSKPSSSPGKDVTAQNDLRDRFIQLTLSLVGQKVTVTQTNGAVIEGIFHTFTPFGSSLPVEMRNMYVIKGCKAVRGPAKEVESAKMENGSRPGYAEVVSEGCTVLIPAEKVSNVHVASMRLDSSSNNGSKAAAAKSAWNGDSGSAFRTDTEISGTKGSLGRGLVEAGTAWTSASAGMNSRANVLKSGGLDERRRGGAGALKGSIGEWDQFQANEKLFEVRASYNENLYTTELDKSGIDKEKIRQAERLAREIEGTVSSNIHVAEERGQKVQGDYDEEDLYSGVLNSKGEARNEVADKKAKEAEERPKNVQPPKKMNYAAAAANVPPSLKAKAPPPAAIPSEPGAPAPATATHAAEGSGSRTETKETESEVDNKEKAESADNAVSGASSATEKKEGKSSSDEKAGEEEGEKPKEEPRAPTESGKEAEEKAEEIPSGETKKKSSKLNPSAKAFTFNPSAKTFTPGNAASVAPTEPSVVPVAMASPQMPGQMHYMHPGPMGQGMMHVMNPGFGGTIRYPPTYMGMEPPMGAVPPPVSTMQPPQGQGQEQTSASTSAAANVPAQDTQPTDATTQQTQQGMPMPYAVPPGGPGGYYGMNPRGSGGPHMGGFPSQMMGRPQQMPVMPGGAPYNMYGGVPPHLQSQGMPGMPMRGPGGGAPYYPPGASGSGGMYPHGPPYGMGGHGPMDDESGYRGGRGNGRGGGRGNRRNSNQRKGRGNGGRGSYQHQHQQPPYQGGAPPQGVAPTEESTEGTQEEGNKQAKAQQESSSQIPQDASFEKQIPPET